MTSEAVVGDAPNAPAAWGLIGDIEAGEGSGAPAKSAKSTEDQN